MIRARRPCLGDHRAGGHRDAPAREASVSASLRVRPPSAACVPPVFPTAFFRRSWGVSRASVPSRARCSADGRRRPGRVSLICWSVDRMRLSGGGQLTRCGPGRAADAGRSGPWPATGRAPPNPGSRRVEGRSPTAARPRERGSAMPLNGEQWKVDGVSTASSSGLAWPGLAARADRLAIVYRAAPPLARLLVVLSPGKSVVRVDIVAASNRVGREERGGRTDFADSRHRRAPDPRAGWHAPVRRPPDGHRRAGRRAGTRWAAVPAPTGPSGGKERPSVPGAGTPGSPGSA